MIRSSELGTLVTVRIPVVPFVREPELDECISLNIYLKWIFNA